MLLAKCVDLWYTELKEIQRRIKERKENWNRHKKIRWA